MSTKRKRAVLSIKDKQIIISRLDKGEKGTNLAQEFGISKQQISDIRKNKDKILKFTDSIETSEGLKRKSLKLADDEHLDKALYSWFIQQRSTGTPISGPLLQEKAKHFSTQLNTGTADREFKASTGWLEKFKTRHGIRNLSIQGEKLSAAKETVEPFLQKLHKVIEEKNLIPEQIYNADETGLLWKCLPQRTLVSCREKSAPGFKKAKDRLTVLGCTNATGTHKLKPVVIGKSAKPRCFKHVNMDALPAIYKSQRNAWMNSEIFAEWFKKDFVPAVKSHQRSQNIRCPKALLLIDNCSAHPDELSSHDGSVTCLFLPPNTTSLIQPMDQGVLQAMKNRYKRKLLQKVICSQDIDPTQSIKDIVKLHTVKDALYMLSDAWYELSPESICKAYDKLRIHSDNSESNSQPEFREDNIAESMVEMLEHVQQPDNEEMPDARAVEDWLNQENGLPTSPQMSDEEILATVVGDSTEGESACSDEEDEGEDEKLVSTKEAAQCFKKCLSWMESQNDIDPVQLMQLRRMMDFAMRSSYKSLKQTNMLEHFRPL